MTEGTKISEELYYDERSAGGLVFRRDEGKIKWMVIQTMSRKNPKKTFFKFPKGHLKDREFLKQAALREVEEEAKIKAKIIAKLGSWNYVMWDKLTKKKTIKKVTFFLMEYREESNLKYFDQERVVGRGWFDFEEALGKLAYDSEKILLKKAKNKLESMVK